MPTVTVSGSGDDQRALQSIADSVARSKKVIFVTGAGISTNSGIPDFRSQDGLYNLVKQKYPQANLTKGKDLFDSVLWNDPTTTSIFYTFVAELRNEVLKVKDTTCTHKFIRTLSETGRLQRCYTQNIDGLEEREGLTTDLSLGKGKRKAAAGKKVVTVEGIQQERDEDKGVQVVQLHGHLRNLRCELCNASHPYDEENAGALSAGLAPECPTCQEKLDERANAGKRTTRIGCLRPSIVLYGEENPDAEMIGKVTQADLSARPDLMIIAGTSLKVHGLKRIVKSFAASIHAKGGKVIYVNNTAAANSVWKDVIDYHVEMDCDRFVTELKEKRPDIWQLQSTLDLGGNKASKPTAGNGKKRKAEGEPGSDSDKENGANGSRKKTKLDGSKEDGAKTGVKKAAKPRKKPLGAAKNPALPPTPDSSPNPQRTTGKPKAPRKTKAQQMKAQEKIQTDTPPVSSQEGTPCPQTPRKQFTSRNFSVVIPSPSKQHNVSPNKQLNFSPKKQLNFSPSKQLLSTTQEFNSILLRNLSIDDTSSYSSGRETSPCPPSRTRSRNAYTPGYQSYLRDQFNSFSSCPPSPLSSPPPSDDERSVIEVRTPTPHSNARRRNTPRNTPRPIRHIQPPQEPKILDFPSILPPSSQAAVEPKKRAAVRKPRVKKVAASTLKEAQLPGMGVFSINI